MTLEIWLVCLLLWPLHTNTSCSQPSMLTGSGTLYLFIHFFLVYGVHTSSIIGSRSYAWFRFSYSFLLRFAAMYYNFRECLRTIIVNGFFFLNDTDIIGMCVFANLIANKCYKLHIIDEKQRNKFPAFNMWHFERVCASVCVCVSVMHVMSLSPVMLTYIYYKLLI